MHWPGRIIVRSMQIEFSYLPVTSEMQQPASLSELWCCFLVEARKLMADVHCLGSPQK